jgi:ABC-type uncharacterized transport system substrate-binding protein
MMGHRRVRRAAGLMLGALVLTAPAVGGAHPHVFVDVRVRLFFGAEGLTGLRVSWTFDEMASSTLHATFDTNRDGIFSAAEMRAIERQFRTLNREHYYLDIRLDGRPVPVGEVTELEASSTDGRVTYAFTVPLPPRRAGVIDVRADDPSYFTAFEPVSGSAGETSSAAGYVVHCRVASQGWAGDVPSINCAYRPRTR